MSTQNIYFTDSYGYMVNNVVKIFFMLI